MMKCLGIHILAEMYQCNSPMLDDLGFVLGVFTEAVRMSGCNILNVYTRKFDPHGITINMTLGESHAALHTWPEYGYVAIDIFTCGAKTQPYIGIQFIKEKLECSKTLLKHIDRGIPEFMEGTTGPIRLSQGGCLEV
jgi:S-adenosylmethionine decarboxylase proenzyme